MELLVKLSKTDIARIQPHMSNWMPVHAYIRQLPPSEETLMELRRMMSLELKREEPRAQIMERLYGRFTSIRKQLEEQALFNKLHVTEE